MALENTHAANSDLTEGLFYRLSAPRRFHTTKTRTGHYGERSFDRLGGAVEQRRWDRQSERLGGLEIDHQLELGRLFDRKVARPGAFENPIDVVGHAPSQVEEPHAVGHQAACEHEFTYLRDRWDLVPEREPRHLRPVGRIGMSRIEQQDANAVLRHGGKCSFQVLWAFDRVGSEVHSERLGGATRFV